LFLKVSVAQEVQPGYIFWPIFPSLAAGIEARGSCAKKLCIVSSVTLLLFHHRHGRQTPHFRARCFSLPASNRTRRFIAGQHLS